MKNTVLGAILGRFSEIFESTLETEKVDSISFRGLKFVCMVDYFLLRTEEKYVKKFIKLRSQ